MKIKFKPVTMNCIQFHDNYDEVVEFIKNEYGNEFDLNFQRCPNSDYYKDYMAVEMTPLEFFNNESYTETHYIEDGDYVVCLPTGELSLYDETYFEQLFELCEEQRYE